MCKPRLQVVGAAILRDGACLVAQRRADTGAEALRWEFPGGKVEPEETPRAALRREIREELGVEIDVGSALGRGEHDGEGGVIDLEVFTARIVSGQIHLTEHRRCGWFRAEQIDELDWATADRPVLPALKRLLSSR